MAFDNPTGIPQKTLRDVAKGLRREDKDRALADELCTVRDENSPAGIIKVAGSELLLGRDGSSNRASHGIKDGAKPPERNSEFDEDVVFQCLRYSMTDTLGYQMVESIRNNTTFQPLKTALGGCMADVAVMIDETLDSLLTDPNQNQTYDASTAGDGPWDTAGSSPLKDIRKAEGEVPGADLLYLGRDVVTALLSNADIIAESSFFNAGQMGETQLAAFIQSKFANVKRVVLGDGFYKNAAEEGQAFQTGYEAPDTCWLGYSDDLHMVRFSPRSPRQWQKEFEDRNSLQVGFERILDLKRGSNDTGIVLQNVTS